MDRPGNAGTRLAALARAIRPEFDKIVAAKSANLLPHEREEAFQDFLVAKFVTGDNPTLMKLLGKDGEAELSKLLPYIKKTIRTFLIDLHRKRSGSKNQEVLMANPALVAEVQPEGPVSVEGEQRLARLAFEVAAKLTPEERLLVSYRMAEEQTLQVISSLFHMPVSTIHDRQRRLASRLGEMLRDLELERRDQRRLLEMLVAMCARSPSEEGESP